MAQKNGGRILRTWPLPEGGIRPAPGTAQEIEVLLNNLPHHLSEHLQRKFAPRLGDLSELYLQLGQIPECIFADPATGKTLREDMDSERCGESHIEMFSNFFCESTDGHKRKGIAGTLHRVSLITHPMRNPQKVLGVAVRVGRAMEGLVQTMTGGYGFLTTLALEHRSLVLIGRPGVGKTTALREIARILAENMELNVVVVDKTCEIAGDGDRPHAAIGKARWMPVGRPRMQHEIMREAVENQSPDVIIVDEITTPQEVEAARTISQRGVQLIATLHGETLPEIINCRERGHLTGGSATVTLSKFEADRRSDRRKQVQKRAREPIFGAALELSSRSKWVYHPDVAGAVDSYMEGDPCHAQQLTPGRATAIMAVPDKGKFKY
mmetsp:Transcript_14304/g.28554  ORF Transcript_14304/g.28554 Transcript_14304/m.28554 type:complete len:381 (-) Transcript_14304:69-1211(-)